MEHMKNAAEKVGLLLNAEIEIEPGKCIVKKKRTIDIHADNLFFPCILDMDISFEDFRNNGFAVNRAEIFLLPEELPAFTIALNENQIPFPTDYQQWQVTNPNIVSIWIKSIEPPEHFAERLSIALRVIE
ncbi:hypothetical protein [Planomicrobium sp. Y74]|uniref:DUF1259 domain-containing protein n=1 Tax=Planomicrobium sp. Y74 TaxID=2478977 RepID=UPI00256FC900|nr:hypothetical protein [Planomicrobium sp. Y74]